MGKYIAYDGLNVYITHAGFITNDDVQTRTIWNSVCLGIVGVQYQSSANNGFVSIVDDDIDISQLFHDTLCEKIDGISVVSFNDPIIAFEHFTTNRDNYVLFISGLRMPGLNGLELLKKVKNSNSDVRTILMSAYKFEEDELFQKYMKDGIIDSIIEKPVTIQRLCQRVRDELQVYQMALILRQKKFFPSYCFAIKNNTS